MGRRRKFGKDLGARKNYDRTKDYFIKGFRSIPDTFNTTMTKKLRGMGIYSTSDLQDLCRRKPEKLLKTTGLGPLKVQQVCKKVGIYKPIKELQKIYRKIGKKK